MLTITQVNYIRELFFDEGRSIKEICIMTGKNYRTIKKYVEMDDFNEVAHQAKRPNKTDAIRPIIEQWLMDDRTRNHKQRHTAKRVYDRLREECCDILHVSERTVRNVVREEKEKVYGAKKAFLLLNHPGGEAQVDFGTFEAFENGSQKKFHELIMSFPKSNGGFAVATRSETREALLEGLITIFSFIGYVPSTLWFDQMSAAVLRVRDEQGGLQVPDFVKRFATHYGFNLKFCNPGSGHEKGNVENKVGTIRRNLFVPEPTIVDLTSFNLELLEKCEKRHQELHYRHKRPIKELFEEEKHLMVPMNKIPFDTARYETRKVNKYGLVEFAGCRYSANPKYIRQSILIKIMANKIEIYAKDMSELISVHPRLFEKGTESIHHIDFIDIVRTRPNALKYSGIYTLLPDSWQRYLATLEKDSYRQAFTVLKTILLEESLEHADIVLQETLKHESTSPEAIMITHRRLGENRALYEAAIEFPADLPTYEVDTSTYDMLMGGDWQ